MRNAKFLSLFATMLVASVSLPSLAESGSAPGAKGGAPAWVAEGPAPIDFGQTEGDTTNREAAGAVNAVAPHPTNPNILYIGGVNGGIWKTNNALATNPNWVQQTDTQASLSIGDLAFDPTDASGQTLVAGIARKSSLRGLGGARTGLLRTTNGGNTWVPIGGMEGRSVIGVAPSGNTIVAAVDVADEFNCGEIGIFRTTNGGATWERTNGMPAGTVDAMARDPINTNTLYASVVFGEACNEPDLENGIYKSLDGGVSWFKSSPSGQTFPLDGLLEDSSNTHVEMAVGNQNNFYVAIAPQSTGQLGSVFYTLDGGALWFQMDLPGSFEPDFFGLHPGEQGNIHMSLAVDPNNPNIVYVGGDRQPATDNDEGGFPMPNGVGASNFSGRLFRGDVTNFEAGEWTPLTHDFTAGGSSPHADSRDMAFDASGNLIEGDDGGVYRRSSPRSTSGDWFTVNGNLQITETHSTAYDSLSDVIAGGNQDNGSTEQLPPGLRWVTIRGGDGGDVAIVRNGNQSIRYASAQTLLSFVRVTYDASNNFVSAVSPALTVVSGPELDAQFTNPLAINPLDSNRLLVGASNTLYESLDRGDTISELPANTVVATNLRINSQTGRGLVYGAGNNPDVIYAAGCIGACGDAADGADGLFLRTSAGGPLNLVYPANQAGFITQVTVSPNNAGTVFFIENDNTVVRATGSGQTFTNVTGNLNNFGAGRLNSIEFMLTPAGKAVAVGTNNGVFIALSSSGYSTWTKLGAGMPNAPVYELRYDPARDKLIAGTLGRGSFSISAFLVLNDILFFADFER